MKVVRAQHVLEKNIMSEHGNRQSLKRLYRMAKSFETSQDCFIYIAQHHKFASRNFTMCAPFDFRPSIQMSKTSTQNPQKDWPPVSTVSYVLFRKGQAMDVILL